MPTGSASPEMKEAFGEALEQAMRDAGRRAPDVAPVANVTDDAVRKWMNGQSEPDPLTVFAVENYLGLEGGELSRHLGYIPVGVVSTLAAIEADTALATDWRDSVINSYRFAVRRSRLQRGQS